MKAAEAEKTTSGRRKPADPAASRQAKPGIVQAASKGTQAVSFRYPIELVEMIDQTCEENHWTRAAFVSRVFSAGLQSEFRRLGLTGFADRVREIG